MVNPEMAESYKDKSGFFIRRDMAKVQAYVSDEVAEKINAIVEKTQLRGLKIRMSAFQVYRQCCLS
jgi:hypothetical protein